MRALLNLVTSEKVYGSRGNKSSFQAVLELQEKGINVEDAKHFRILETLTMFPEARAEKDENLKQYKEV